MSKKSMADWWKEKRATDERKKAGQADVEDVEALYDRLGREPAVDASLEVIRKEMAAVYRDMRAGRIDCNDGTRLAYVLDMLRKTHESNVVKNRLGALEKAMGVKSDTGPEWLGLPFGNSD